MFIYFCKTKYDPLSCPINFYTTTLTKLFEGEKFFELLINYNWAKIKLHGNLIIKWNSYERLWVLLQLITSEILLHWLMLPLLASTINHFLYSHLWIMLVLWTNRVNSFLGAHNQILLKYSDRKFNLLPQHIIVIIEIQIHKVNNRKEHVRRNNDMKPFKVITIHFIFMRFISIMRLSRLVKW